MSQKITNISSSLLTGQSNTHIYWLNDFTGIHTQVKKPWLALQKAANLAGFDLQIVSGFRHFDRQLMLWNKKYLQQLPVKDKNNAIINLEQLSDDERVTAILLYTALPGASRHHWGTDLDLYATNLLPKNKLLQLEPWEYQQSGYFAELTHWLAENAPLYDFFQPYDKDRGGVAIEPWHFSYAPLAQQYQQALTLEQIEITIKSSTIYAKEAILNQLTNIYQRYIMNTSNL